MTETIVFQNDSAVLRYHSDGIVHHEFLTRMIGKDFRDLLLKGYEQMKKSGATKWLSDDRKHSVLDEADMKWGNEVWFPMVKALNWKHWAIVNPEKAVGQMQMRGTAKVMELGGVQVRFFSTPAEALSWLRSVDAAPVKKAG